MLAAVFTILFGLSLLPGRTPLCLRFARRISGGILPDGAAAYCWRLTAVWFFVLLATTALNGALLVRGRAAVGWSLALTPAVVAATFFVEGIVRRRRFSVTFRTSGSSGASKTVVKTFESLAKETAFHRDWYRARGVRDGVTVLATIEPDHMYGTLWRTMLPAALGLPVDPEVIRAPESLVAKMCAAEKVFLVTTPSFLDRFTAYAAQYDVPPNCVEIVTSGALLTADVAARTRAVFGVTPREIFGSTETGGVAWRRQDGACPPDGCDWQVFDAVKVATAADGRLAVRSPYSFRRRYVMGDAVTLTADGRRFRLLGRVDRLVKINEERVNLAEMEAAVRARGFADCALAVLPSARGDILGCLLVAGADGARRPPLELRKMLLDVFPKGTVPKKFRYVHALPRNAQGKVRAADVRAELESALAEPRLRDVVETADSFAATLTFEPQAPYFQGHFPGVPILPGVVQLGLAVKFAARLGGGAAPTAVKKMKFQHVVMPGEPIAFQVARTGANEWTYSYRKGENPCSSGVLVF